MRRLKSHQSPLMATLSLKLELFQWLDASASDTRVAFESDHNYFESSVAVKIREKYFF
jgi:hypothetical protein